MGAFIVKSAFCLKIFVISIFLGRNSGSRGQLAALVGRSDLVGLGFVNAVPVLDHLVSRLIFLAQNIITDCCWGPTIELEFKGFGF